MTRTRAAVALAVAALVLGAAACSDSNGPAVPVTAVAALTTPRTDDGAVLVTITGPGLADVQPANSFYRLYWRLASDSELRVVVVGDVAQGPLFTVSLSSGRVSQYTATVTDAASRADAAREALSGYAVTLSAAAQQ